MVQLYPSQQEILDEIKDKNRCAIFAGVGSGKTYIGGEKLMSFQTDWNLVICQKSQVDYWVNHFETHYPNTTVTDLTKVSANSFGNIRPGVLIINYDLAFRRPLLTTLKNFSLMLDESSLIQNMSAKRTKFILKLKPDNVVLLSGTPVSGGKINREKGLIFGRYENLISQLHLLGWKVTQKSFWETYVNWDLKRYGEVRVKEIVSYKRIDELNNKLKELGCVFRRTEDIVELPDEHDQHYYVKMTPEYRKMKKTGLVEIGDTKLVAEFPTTKFLRLRQLCGAYNNDKLNMLSDLLDTLENERVIIFYSFVEDLNQIKKILGKRPMSQINGEVKDLTAYEKYDNSVTLCQYQSGARGHNLQKAAYIIYFNPTVSPELFDQSRGRIRRNGQKRSVVNYYHLLVNGSIEEKILSKVSRGLEYTVEDYIADYERNENLNENIS